MNAECRRRQQRCVHAVHFAADAQRALRGPAHLHGQGSARRHDAGDVLQLERRPDAADLDLQGRPDSLTNDSTATFTFLSTDSVQPNFQCSLNGGAYTPCTSPTTYTGLGDGTRTFSEEAVDQAGNVQLKPNSYTWTTDVTPPDTTILSGPPSLSNQTLATFDVVGSDQAYPGDSFVCSVDGAPLTPEGCGDGGSVSVGAGKHTFAVAAVDEVGNVDPTPATYSWTVDLTPPKPPILHLGPATSTSPTYQELGDDQGELECRQRRHRHGASLRCGVQSRLQAGVGNRRP